MPNAVRYHTFTAALALFFACRPDAIAEVNQPGYLQLSGLSPAIPTYSTGTATPRFLWDPSDGHLQAGTALPSQSTAGANSFAFGQSIYQLGPGSFAFGSDISAAGSNSFAFGPFETSASGSCSFAFGNMASANGSGTLAFGQNSSAYGQGAIAIGPYSRADGYGSAAIGRSSIVDLPTSGTFNETNSSAYAIGYGLTVAEPFAFVVGKFNSKAATDSSLDYRFVVGNGSSAAARSDVFWVDASGNVGASGTISGTFSGSGSGLTGLAGNQLFSGNGNVGVGIASPTSKLTVQSGSTDSDSPEWARHGLSITTGDNYETLWLGFDSIRNIAYIGAAEYGAIRPVVLQPRGGAVAIGTLTPDTAYSLHVSGPVRIDGTLTLNSTAGDISMGAFAN